MMDNHRKPNVGKSAFFAYPQLLRILKPAQHCLAITVFLASIVIPAIALSQTFIGKVISVADGDTITILTNTKQQVVIRLYGIDTPESGQAFGNKAKQFTSSLVFGKQAEITAYDIDKYGRTVGVVVIANGKNVNEEIIKAGYAWQYRKYCKESFCADWLKNEENARNGRIGLWYDNSHVPPWEWRKGSEEAASNAYSISSANVSGRFHGNVKSHVLHAPRCQHYSCKNCTAMFSSVDEALRAGYRVHEQCVR